MLFEKAAAPTLKQKLTRASSCWRLRWGDTIPSAARHRHESEVGAFYWIVLVPESVIFEREKHGLVSVMTMIRSVDSSFCTGRE